MIGVDLVPGGLWLAALSDDVFCGLSLGGDAVAGLLLPLAAGVR